MVQSTRFQKPSKFTSLVAVVVAVRQVLPIVVVVVVLVVVVVVAVRQALPIVVVVVVVVVVVRQALPVPSALDPLKTSGPPLALRLQTLAILEQAENVVFALVIISQVFCLASIIIHAFIVPHFSYFASITITRFLYFALIIILQILSPLHPMMPAEPETITRSVTIIRFMTTIKFSTIIRYVSAFWVASSFDNMVTFLSHTSLDNEEQMENRRC